MTSLGWKTRNFGALVEIRAASLGWRRYRVRQMVHFVVGGDREVVVPGVPLRQSEMDDVLREGSIQSAVGSWVLLKTERQSHAHVAHSREQRLTILGPILLQNA
jgi:hypothetical protein